MYRASESQICYTILMKTKILSIVSLWLVPAIARAQCTFSNNTFSASSCFNWNLGVGNLTPGQVIGNIIATLRGSIDVVAACVFFIGAFFYGISAGDENRKNTGKNMMMGALIAIAIVEASTAIMNTILYFVYG